MQEGYQGSPAWSPPGKQAVPVLPVTRSTGSSVQCLPKLPATSLRYRELHHPGVRGCSIPAHRAAFAQHSGAEPRSGNRLALAPAAVQKETTPFPRAVLQPWPRHQGPLRPCREHCGRRCAALPCSAAVKRAPSTPATKRQCSGSKELGRRSDYLHVFPK